MSEISCVTETGFWLLVEDREYFVPFEDYPAFRQATVQQLFHLERQGDQCHWPDLDADIELEALEHPERFPLQYR